MDFRGVTKRAIAAGEHTHISNVTVRAYPEGYVILDGVEPGEWIENEDPVNLEANR
jgi:hypothetical protein